MSWVWALIKAGLPLVLGMFGFAPKNNQGDIDRAAGEELGRAKQNAAANERMLKDAKKSADAGRAAAADDAEPGGVRKPHVGDRPWNPDGLE